MRSPHEYKLPVVLTREEVRRVLSSVRIFRHRACLTTIYACGLRIGEGTRLHIGDIDSQRMLVHIKAGKGNKDRYVPLPESILHLLRKFWKTHRNTTWLFPAPGRSGTHMHESTKPLPLTSVQIVFKTALRECRIYKSASVHTLRHSGVYPAFFAGPRICWKTVSISDLSNTTSDIALPRRRQSTRI